MISRCKKYKKVWKPRIFVPTTCHTPNHDLAYVTISSLSTMEHYHFLDYTHSIIIGSFNNHCKVINFICHIWREKWKLFKHQTKGIQLPTQQPILGTYHTCVKCEFNNLFHIDCETSSNNFHHAQWLLLGSLEAKREYQTWQDLKLQPLNGSPALYPLKI